MKNINIIWYKKTLKTCFLKGIIMGETTLKDVLNP